MFIIDSIISDDQAGGSDGAFYTPTGNITVINSTFTHNIANSGGGGAICSGSSPYANITMRNNTFTNNSARIGWGGAILIITMPTFH